MSEKLSDAEQQTWRAFLSASVRLLEHLDHELQQRSRLSLTDYEILSQLSEAPDERLRMSGLAERVLVSRSRLTYRVDRLAGLDYVRREECEDDRRGLFAMITPEGREAFDESTPGHVNDIRGWFFDLIDPEDMETLAELFARMDEKLASS